MPKALRSSTSILQGWVATETQHHPPIILHVLCWVALRLTQPTDYYGSSGFCVETRSILIEYPQNSPKSLSQ